MSCTITTDVKTVMALNVSPMTKKDLEVLQLSPTRVQSELLEQIRIVNRGQVIIAWISRSIYLSLKVDAISPAIAFGRLENNTQLIVSTTVGGDPLARYKVLENGDSSSKKNPPPSSVLDRFHKRMSNSSSFEDDDLSTRVANVVRREPKDRNGYAPKRSSYIDSDELSPSPSRSNLKVDEFNGMLNGLRKSVTMADMKFKDVENEVRGPRRRPEVSPADSWHDVRNALEKKVSEGFEFRVISCKWDQELPICNGFITRANRLQGLDTDQLFLLKTNGDKEYYINLKLVEDSDFPTNIYPTIKLNENLMQLLELQPFERVVLKPKQTLLNRVDKIELIPSKKIDEGSRDARKIETAFNTHIIDHTRLYPLLLNQDQVIKLADFIVSVKLWPTSLKCAQIDSKILRENKVDVLDDCKNVASVVTINEKEKNDEAAEKKCKLPTVEIGKFEEVRKQCVDRLKTSLCLDQVNSTRISDNLLFVGEFLKFNHTYQVSTL